MIGTTIKEFKLLERLGKGGWGEVWAAEQQIVKTRVAIKLLRSEVSGDQAHVRRFFNEAIAVAAIPHAGIVKIFDVGFIDVGLEHDQAFLIMELLPGESLTTRIRRETRLPLGEVIDIGRQIASVLVATHDAGIVHRDLKPDNVFVVPDAELGERVKILDFGIAKLSTVAVTGTGALGTPAYMAPEQWNNAADIDGRADLYSLGCVLFEMCCGRSPFLAESPGEACTKHLTETPPRARSLAPALPVELDDLIDRLLAKRAADRPTLAEIDRVLTTAAVTAPRVIRSVPRGSGPNLRLPANDRNRSKRTADGTAETLSSTSNAGNAATVTSLAGAVIVQTQPPPQPKRRVLAIVGGVLAIAGIATAIGLATRTRDESTAAKPEPQPKLTLFIPAVGLQAIGNYREPTPSTVGNQRSEQVWLGAHESFEKACPQPGAPAMWCAGKHFALGELSLIRDDVPGSIKRFEEAIAADPTWSTGYLGLANASAHARELVKALAAARKAEALEPASWQPALASARAYISVNQVDDALMEYRRAMSKSPPKNAVMLSEIALAFHFAHKDDEAQKLAAQASAIDPSLVPINVLYAELALEAGDGAKALSISERALAVSPKNGAALIARGDALALLGRRAEAIETYKHALKLRGGMNILAISEPRLQVIETALANEALPPRRSNTRSPSKEHETTTLPGASQAGLPSRSGTTPNPGGPSPREQPTGGGGMRSPTMGGSPGGGGRPSKVPVAPTPRTAPTPSADLDSTVTRDDSAARSPPVTNQPARTPPSSPDSTTPQSSPAKSPRSPPKAKPPSERSPPTDHIHLK